MSCIAVMYLNISIAHSDDDLTHFGIIPYNWEWAIPASPVILHGRGAMIIDQAPFIAIVLTSDSCLSA
eukprot:8687933-Pyramimonas_sp.AAC.1